jgi:hypothetical protein
MMTAEHDRYQRIKRKYGIDEIQWHRLWDALRGHCPLCLKPFSSSRLACVDHNHETGLVRGLICSPCNYAIGERHDDAGWFRRAADYLDNPPSIHEHVVVYVPGSIGAARQEWQDPETLCDADDW